MVTTGQAGDSPALPVLLDQLRIPRLGYGRPRTTPEALRGNKAYSAKAHRDHLRARGVKVMIPEKADQQANRRNRGSRGGRPVIFDAEDYKNRNVVERAFNKLKNWRGGHPLRQARPDLPRRDGPASVVRGSMHEIGDTP